MENPGTDAQSSEIGRKLTKYPSRLWNHTATWWRSYRSWESDRYGWKISSYGIISIVRESSGNYLTTITATLTYSNTDGRCPLDIFPELVMHIPYMGSGRTGDYYKLTTQDLGIQRIAPESSLDIEHVFTISTGAPPLLSGTAKCVVRGQVAGEMDLPEGIIKGELHLDGNNTFDTKVRKEWIRE